MLFSCTRVDWIRGGEVHLYSTIHTQGNFKCFAEAEKYQISSSVAFMSRVYFWFLSLLTIMLASTSSLCSKGDMPSPTELSSPDSHIQRQEEKPHSKTNNRAKRPRGNQASLVNKLQTSKWSWCHVKCHVAPAGSCAWSHVLVCYMFYFCLSNLAPCSQQSTEENTPSTPKRQRVAGDPSGCLFFCVSSLRNCGFNCGML